jgi:hypothetical protein
MNREEIIKRIEICQCDDIFKGFSDKFIDNVIYVLDKIKSHIDINTLELLHCTDWVNELDINIWRGADKPKIEIIIREDNYSVHKSNKTHFGIIKSTEIVDDYSVDKIFDDVIYNSIEYLK